MAKLTLDGLKAKLTTNQLRAAELLLEKNTLQKERKNLRRNCRRTRN